VRERLQHSAKRVLPARLRHQLSAAREVAQDNRALLDRTLDFLPGATKVWTPLADRLLPGKATEANEYEQWCQRFVDSDSPEAIRNYVLGLDNQPVISIILPIHQPSAYDLTAAIDSVTSQLYPNWQLCLIDDASHDDRISAIIARAALDDPRIVVRVHAKRRNVVSAINHGIDAAWGEYVTFLDHDDLLTPDALCWVVASLNQHPSAKLLYTDDDKLTPDGERVDPYFKPDWDPVLLLGQNYLNHLLIVERNLLLAHNGVRTGSDGVHDWDLALRLTHNLAPDEIVHIPAVCYHWRVKGSAPRPLMAYPSTLEAATEILSDAMTQRQLNGTIEPVGALDRLIHYTHEHSPPTVLIIAYLDDQSQPMAPDELSRALALIQAIDYPEPTIVLLLPSESRASIEGRGEHSSTPLGGSDRSPNVGRLQGARGLRIVDYDTTHGIGAQLNQIVADSDAECVCLFPLTSMARTTTWLREMVGLTQLADVGAVGGLVVTPEGTIDNAGVVLGLDGTIERRYHGDPDLSTGHRNRLRVNQSVTGVTGGPILTLRQRFIEVGGVDDRLGGELRDVDLCLKLKDHGYRCCLTPMASFVLSATSATQIGDPKVPSSQEAMTQQGRFLARWSSSIGYDRYYNPNLDIEAATFFPNPAPPPHRPWCPTPRWQELPMARPERFFPLHYEALEPNESIACELTLDAASQLTIWIEASTQGACRIDLIDPADEVVASFAASISGSRATQLTGEICKPHHGSTRYRLVNASSMTVAIEMVRIGVEEVSLHARLKRLE
jgi:GT2 family glycosyltransferase